MMNTPYCCLTDPLPDTFETDFRAWIVFDNLTNRARTPQDEQELLDYAQTRLVHGALTQSNLDAFLTFYRCGETEQQSSQRIAQVFGSEYVRGYDFAIDGAMIAAAFWQAYQIDLMSAQMHWWTFMALFRALPEQCRISKIIEYRTADTSQFPKETKELYEKLRRAYALPDAVGGETRRYATFDERKAEIRRKLADKRAAGA